MITRSLCQAVHGSIINEICSFTVHTYNGSPKLAIQVIWISPWIVCSADVFPVSYTVCCGLTLSGLCFGSEVSVVFSD